MVTPLGWLERVPTYKEALDNVKDKDLHTYGFLGYPILQTADIVMYSNPGTNLFVPVGEDQVSHIEFSRELVRRFNTFYGLSFEDKFYSAVIGFAEKPGKYPVELSTLSVFLNDHLSKSGEKLNFAERDAVFRMVRGMATEFGVKNFLENFNLRDEYASFREVLTEPQHLLSPSPRIPGTDGRKMSKSYGNSITFGESDVNIRAKTKVMMTDPARKRRTDPGNPDVCPVYDWHKLFSSPETLAWSAEGCRSAGIGCIECKSAMADNLIQWIAPIRARREEYAAHPGKVLQILDEGSLKAREVAQKTMVRVREAVFNWKDKRAEVSSQISAAQNAKVGD